ncbi:Glutamate racemase [Marinobacter nitratireducens]|uniref:Glutamate racemase n=1 Tax=Marinobacter nitratireducens TaxID=1137280 RepID=A0A072N0J6_9GAMM|nr:glutamate racemase [Marinobacter nitratireducens]KEF31046.1 Glutamate racemase [Marinobacter nitratireducens]
MKSAKLPRVLVFDSGVGGLSVAACIRHQLPGVELVYLADNAVFPYGDQSESTVIERCERLISGTLECFPSDVVVVACNTASTVVLPHLRAAISVPVVGVVPAIKPAATKTRNGRIGVLATPATIRRPYLENLITEFASHCDISRVGHPDLVRWVEDSVRGMEVPHRALSEAVSVFNEAGVDTVVLGCTHYPLLLDALRQVLPQVEFWVDSGEAIARRVAHLLEELGKLGVARVGEPGRAAPVMAALFSGKVPEGLAEFMAGLDLRPEVIHGAWSGNPA